MGSSRRHQETQLLGWAILVLVLGQCHGSRATRNSHVFKVKNPPINNSINPQSPNRFLDLLPRGLPFPYSGPSRKHNGIGLETRGRAHPSSSPP